MNAFPRRRAGVFCAWVLAATVTHPAVAAWPDDKPIRMIVPYTAGGASDTLGRMVAAHLTTTLKQTVVVENRPGAGSMLGSQFVARADPDGYTFLLGSISNVLNNFFYKDPLYDLRRDLAPVAQLVTVPNYLAVAPSVPAKTIPELIALAKKDGKGLSCSTSGIGSSPYLSCELFRLLSGAQIINVPFKGGAQAIQAAIGQQSTMVFANEALPFITSGQLRALGVTTPKRAAFLPDVPAIGESLKDYDVTAWYGVWAPAGTPSEVLERVSEDIKATLAQPQARKTLATLGAEPAHAGPKAFGQYVEQEMQRWQTLTQSMNVKPQ
ncbi:putattive exported protein [Bordetella ansorpii]|uniref:Putattive exported protein n=1 Tax=Bordetella ansorpii TaxID=288768 RepID=A0A157PJV2_9BORD|nr:tripartite tricarboxylate transporter substrate binding protein [Bordetella ansorpii]SAI33189.1 putattive exported protein [Bordetella ansorpii]